MEGTSAWPEVKRKGFPISEMKFRKMRNRANLIVLLSIILTGSRVKSYAFQDYSSLDDEEFGSTSLDSGQRIKDTKIEGENGINEEKWMENPVVLLESFLSNFNRNPERFPAVTEISSDNLLLEHLSEIHKTDYQDHATERDNRTNQSLTRRDIGDSWQSPIDIVDGDSFPWSYDSYYPRETKYVANDYGDYSNSLGNVNQKTNASAFDGDNKEQKIQYQPQQTLFRSNHHTEYDSRKSYRNFQSDGFEDSTRRRGTVNLKKYFSRNPCKQYLEFLRYAFEKLDEGYEYEDDYVSNNNDKTGKDKLLEGIPYEMYSRVNADNLALIPIRKNNENRYESTALPHWPSQSSSASPSSFASSATPMPFTLSASPENQDRITTITPWSRISESFSSTASQTTKETVTEIYSTTSNPMEYSSTVTPMLIFERKEHGFGESNHRERYQTEYQNFEKTTASMPTPGPAFTAAPRWLFPENYFQNLGNAMSRMPSIVSTLTTAGTIWPTYGSTVNTEDFTTVTQSIPADDSVEASKTDDNDCNDKILPCPDTYNITYPLNGYCNRYVSCESGRGIRRTCPEGLHFNILTKSCDLPHNSFCNYACTEPEGYFGIPGDCGGYFVCKKSFAEYRMCPPRMHWDTSHDVCTFVESSNCPMKCTQANQILHYEGDCKAYIICLNGLPYYHRCPPNTKFDRSSSTCVPEHLSKCEDDPKLMTRILNPNLLCKSIQMKFGSEPWCDYYRSKETKL